MTVDSFKFEYPRVLSIAGSDSGGGAGIQADLKTFSALGCFGMTAITALTAQNTCGVRAIHAVPPQMLRDQIDAVMEDIGADAVKIGMLHSPEIVLTVAEAIDRYAMTNVVFDPVMVATSGAVLIDNTALDVLVRELFPRATVITPNLDEAALLVGRALTTSQDMEQAALTLLDKGARAVLIKGGHLPGDTVIDLLVMKSGEKFWMQAPRIHSPNTHGTGCTLSSAMAAHLALGASLVEAVQHARAFVREALQAGAQVRTGKGSGPLNHGHAPVAMRLIPLR
ncbi:MAG: bifunctional hydroxymethylpyrimidine kinase/phosphomethylpyrimidine kinase [Rhodoferax sp.]|uniref:bifunctional hydroxymethylpyrimidine kinase/phosphomethylpyrimidine kinase n=1 Tax=Rhodoferax sp. TaxID=50421 RepID=UPI00183F6F2E|nr:bifunctional hydroxymethylpyrimidine kinase/phosphomethylpyrimidine kinase [Rhodoferax sp.]NMM12957.1 bifunctional hydroxymethylpyrimidine kinase/phosphomethylpyrimidine kinase [Rhodoferax sp.]NMM21159.1 bifunctional hydroxymethylpyrimidine kinase/phosphomethylpyrimidine kinase [Rhodoferax sp.]